MDLMNVCRTCMSSTTLNPIFPLPEAHERFSNAIFIVTGAKVAINDGLPQKMCLECLKQVNESMKFRAKCKETEETLTKIKNEVRRAEKHNKYERNKKNIIREIKVDNRWIKINNSNVATTEIDDEQPLVHLIDETNDSIQNIFINDADGQVLPLEMLKVEIDASNIEGDTYEVAGTIEGVDYCINNSEYIVHDAEHSNNNQEDITNAEDTINAEDVTNDEEETIDEHVDTVNDEENPGDEQGYVSGDDGNVANDNHETVHDEEYIIPNAAEHMETENVSADPQYTITIADGNFTVHKNTSANDSEETFNDPDNSELLKTYYIMKEEVSDEDAKEEQNVEEDAVENPDYDNINISENQEIVVMDNKESLYVIDMSNPSSKRVTCKLCQKSLSIRSIDLHLSKSHPGADGRRIKCQLCDNFVVREKMVHHRLVMHGADAYQCRYCKGGFEKEEALVEHIMCCPAKKRKPCESGKELVECDVCHKTMQKASLRLHTEMRHGGLRPVCDHCGKSFGNKVRLNEHCRARHGHPKLKCSRCSFESASRMALRNHERRHSGEKPFVCERCGKKFHAAYLLAQHRQSHRTDKSYKCEACSARFKTNNSLHAHRRSCPAARRLRPPRHAPADPPEIHGVQM